METAALRCPGNMLAYFIWLCFFFFLVSAYTNSAVTDGLRDFEINGVAIPSLFPYILPIALSDSGYCLSTGTQRGSRSLKEYRK